MEKKTSIALALFFGLLSIAVSLPLTVGKANSAKRIVSVKGLCEREVMADRAIWPVVIKEAGNSLTDLASSADNNIKVVTAWLADGGFSEDEITVAAPKIENMKASGYTNAAYAYSMKTVITVCTDKVTLVSQMQRRQLELVTKGIAISSGESWENPTTYDYVSLNEIKPEMIEQATLNARAAADKFAKDSGSRVGEIVRASQGQFSITDRDSNTPWIKVVRVVTGIDYRLR